MLKSFENQKINKHEILKKHMENNRKYILLVFILMFSILPIMALDSMITTEQGKCINISQTCSTCSYVNISSISNNEDSNLEINIPMNYLGNGEWRYEFCDTNYIGRHDVKGQGDIDGADSGFATSFMVTSNGKSGNENTMLFIIAIVLLYGLTLLFFFKRIAPLTALTGMAMVFLGIYMINNGILIFRDSLTNYIGYVTSFLGGGISLWAIIEWIQDSM